MDIVTGSSKQNKPNPVKDEIQPNFGGTKRIYKNNYTPLTRPVFVNSGMRIGG